MYTYTHTHVLILFVKNYPSGNFSYKFHNIFDTFCDIYITQFLFLNKILFDIKIFVWKID